MREERRIFEQRSDASEVDLVDVVGKHDAVRVAHREAGNTVLGAADLDRRVDDARHIERNRYGGCREIGRTHIDGDRRNETAACIEMQSADARAGLNGHVAARHNAVIVEIFTDAAERVARNVALGAVAVEDAHCSVGAVAVLDEHDAEAAYSAMAVAELDAKRLGAEDAAVEILDIDIVVARCLHLREVQLPRSEEHTSELQSH